MKEYKVKRYGRDRRHQKTAATLKTVLMVLLDRRGLRRRVVFV